MSMEDKILDDDDIIDLTDLLEEGQSSKKAAPVREQGAKPHAPMNEPDSFDLGKEISMEYDVSVEEIDGSDGLEVKGDLSVTEEAALALEKELKEEAVLDEKEVKELDFSADTLGEEHPDAPVEASPTARDESRGLSDDLLVRGPVPAATPKTVPGFDRAAPAPVVDDVRNLSFEEYSDKAPEFGVQVAAGGQAAGVGIEIDRAAGDGGAGTPVVDGDEISAALREQAPAIIEAVVKPLMAELVRDMIAATREQLPGIVEKIVREEIEKLRKLDS